MSEGRPGGPFHRPLRGDFPVANRMIDGNRVVYLDSAATALKPQAVIDAMVDYYSRIGANIHRGKHYLSEEASTLFEEARYKIAQLIGCLGNEVVFVRNTTEALGMVASGLSLEPTDLVVGSLDAHHSQILPWRRTAKIELVRVDRTGRVDLDHYRELVQRKPRVVAITHCSNVTGAYAPVQEMVRLARESGALTVIDAAQSIPHRRIDVATLGADFVAFSGHKMMGPTGIGVLYGRRELLERLTPLLLGGGAADWVDVRDHRLRKIPHRFEAGTPHIAGALGLAAAASYLSGLGYDAVCAHDEQLARTFLAEALRRDYLEILGPTTQLDRAAILSVRVRGCADLSDVARILSDSYGIMCRTGHHCAQPFVDAFSTDEVLRASAYLYNTPEEIIDLFAALDELTGRLSKGTKR